MCVCVCVCVCVRVCVCVWSEGGGWGWRLNLLSSIGWQYSVQIADGRLNSLSYGWSAGSREGRERKV